MDSTPAKIREFLRIHSLTNAGTIVINAATKNRVDVLEWLHERIPGGVTAEDCRADNNYALRCAAHYGHVAVLEWLATKLTLAEFAKLGRENVWLQVRRGSMLALVVAGKRKKMRLPPELWDLVVQWY
jgi:hypothetical protein